MRQPRARSSFELAARKGDVKLRAAAGGAFEPGPSTVGFGNFFDDGEANARAAPTIRRGFQGLKYVEDAFVVLIGNTLARIGNRVAEDSRRRNPLDR